MSAPTPYDEVVYESHAYPATHPDHLASMARLFGMTPTTPTKCRVLELGSAAGGNLMPLAAQLPDAEFVGVDLSRVEIGIGQDHITQLGLTNLSLHARDILEVKDHFGTFDYVLCHGVYSWVPRPVQDEILRLCRTLLNPHGVAYVSYNCYPGWHMRGAVRDMMMYHSLGFDTPEDKTSQARALLDFLANAAPESDDPYATLLRNEAALLRNASDYYLYHEHLSAENAPLYFHQFMDRAHTAGLQFLGEASLATMLPEQFPEHVRDILGQITGDILKMEQYMDFVRNRMFRQTLLVHDEHVLERTLTSAQVHGFHLSSGVTWPDSASMTDDSEVTFDNDEQTIVTESPVVKTALSELGKRWPETMPFEDLVALVFDTVHPDDPADAEQALGGNLLRCMASGVVEHRTTPGLASRASDHPVSWPFARFQVSAKMERLTTLRHQTADVDILIRRVVALLDGTRDRDGLIAGLMEDVAAGRLNVSSEEGDVTDPALLLKVFDEVADSVVKTLERQSLLVG